MSSGLVLAGRRLTLESALQDCLLTTCSWAVLSFSLSFSSPDHVDMVEMVLLVGFSSVLSVLR